MYFATLFSAAVVVLGVSAAPSDLVERQGAHEVFHVTKFSGRSIPHSSNARYDFSLSGIYFEKTKCHALVSRGDAIDELIPVKAGEGKCDDDNITFTFSKHFENGEYFGWDLNIKHKYDGTSDTGSFYFPKNHIKEGGENTGVYMYVSKPKNFKMATQHHV